MAIQHGESHIPIVGDMHGLSAYRSDYVTWAKRNSQRTHRHRVAAQMKLLARQAMDPDDFDGQPAKSEVFDAWTLW